MYSPQEIYRKQMLSRIQMWESELAQLRTGIGKLQGDVRLRCDAWLIEVEARNRQVFNCYADLLGSETGKWDEKRALLDAAADQMQSKLMDFAIQAHPSTPIA